MAKDKLKLPPLSRDGLGLPDLQEWIAFYGGFSAIPPAAWDDWDKQYETFRAHQKLARR